MIGYDVHTAGLGLRSDAVIYLSDVEVFAFLQVHM
jgi:hypothetical protein